MVLEFSHIMKLMKKRKKKKKCAKNIARTRQKERERTKQLEPKRVEGIKVELKEEGRVPQEGEVFGSETEESTATERGKDRFHLA